MRGDTPWGYEGVGVYPPTPSGGDRGGKTNAGGLPQNRLVLLTFGIKET